MADIGINDKFDLYDVIYVAKCMNGTVDVPDNLENWDLNGSGKIDFYDAVYIADQIINEIPVDTIDVQYNGSISDSEKGIKIENVTCEPGETVEIPINMVNVSSQGCVAVIECDEALTISNVTKCLTNEYADFSTSKLAALWATNGEPIENLCNIEIEIPADIDFGTYNVNIAIIQLDDNGEYAKNPVGVSGTITVKDPTEPSTGEIGIEVGKVEAVQGDSISVPVYLRGSNIESGEFAITVDYPLSITNFIQTYNYATYIINDSVGYAFYAVDVSGVPADTLLGYVEVDIADDAAPGEYPINVSLGEIYDISGEYVENPVAKAGTVVVDEYIYFPIEPIEPPTEPTTDYPQTDYPTDDWTDGAGIELGKVGSVQGAEVIVPVYLRGSNIESGDFAITVDYPLHITNFIQTYNYAGYNISNDSVGYAFYAVDVSGVPADTLLGYVEVDIADDAAPGEYPINVSLGEIYDISGEYVENPVAKAGTVVVEETDIPVNGDVNGNGKADLYDAIIICKCIIGADDVTEEERKYADVDGDGDIDLYDAIYVAECMIGMH
ncbi:MAG: dockerin type I domain-containing protein [Ruminococcus sp.]|nr:dockerin type I domain-containing protein [Ruminococcus sp.]